MLCLPSLSILDAFPQLHHQGGFTFLPCYQRKDEGGVMRGEDLAV